MPHDDPPHQGTEDIIMWRSLTIAFAITAGIATAGQAQEFQASEQQLSDLYPGEAYSP